ncbi:MAG: hypothetical protein OEZ32_13040 [Nitrospinota bacterium]|nr:hypothetical protein [Nitrospinota bacterium]
MNEIKMAGGAKKKLLFIAVSTAFLYFFHIIYGGFFPNKHGLLGLDYTYFFPRFLDGFYWYQNNGLWRIPWFTPSFCGGVPSFGNPQSMYYSVPQVLMIFMDPLDAVYCTVMIFAFAGFAGFYLLLNSVFKVRWPLSYLGAALFMFNGFYTHRMIIGHVPFHAYQLAPLACYFLLRPLPGQDRISRFMFDVVMAAVIFTLMINSGMLALGLPVVALVAMVGSISGICNGRNSEFWSRFVLAGLFALILGASRLTATLAFMSQFERSIYDFPGGLRSASHLVWLLAQTLYFWPDEILIVGARFWMGSKWFFHDFHSYEFSVTVAPLLLLVPGLYGFCRTLVKEGMSYKISTAFFLDILVIASVLSVICSLLFSFQDPSWTALMKRIPIVKSYSRFTEWICLLIPSAIIVPLVIFDRYCLKSGNSVIAVAVACLAVGAVQVATRDNSHYENQFYNYGKIDEAFRMSREGKTAPQVITIEDHTLKEKAEHTNKMLPVLNGDDYLSHNASPMNCFEPLFGYSLEKYPRGKLHPGLAMEERSGFLNLKNPACYSYPDENACRPGDHYRADQRDVAERFRKYKSIEFNMSYRQNVANWMTIIGLGLAMSFMVLYSVKVVAFYYKTGDHPPADHRRTP